MALCSSNCAYNPPNPVGTNCKIDLRPGGLGRLILFACDIQFTDITDLNEWCTYRREGRIVISPKILGQKTENEYTEKLVNSCDPEIVTGMKQTIEWKDYNADDEFFTDFDFYNTWNANRDFYNVGFVTCDGLFYGIIENYSLKLSHIIEENYNDSSYWMGSLSFNNTSELKPILIYNLVENLLSVCANMGYYGGSTISGGTGCDNALSVDPLSNSVFWTPIPMDRNISNMATPSNQIEFQALECCRGSAYTIYTTTPGFTITDLGPGLIQPDLNGDVSNVTFMLEADLNVLVNGIYNIPVIISTNTSTCSGIIAFISAIEIIG